MWWSWWSGDLCKRTRLFLRNDDDGRFFFIFSFLFLGKPLPLCLIAKVHYARDQVTKKRERGGGESPSFRCPSSML